MRLPIFARRAFIIAMLAGGALMKPTLCHASTLDQYTDIVVAASAPAAVQGAARDLQYHLQKICARDIPLSADAGAAAKEGLHFFVGAGALPEQDADVAKLPAEGYLLRSVPRGLVFSGNKEGVRHAVSLFLEDTCGVRWLWPGRSGEVIPVNPRLPVPDLDLTGAPPLIRRKLTFFPRFWDQTIRADLNTWVQRTRQGDQLNANFGHSWATVMPAKEYFAAHPEWYSEVSGKRIPAQLCTSNPQLRDQFVKNLLALPANQKLDIVSVSANDGYGFCECPLCRAKGDTNAAYWDFVNDIATRVKALKPGLGIGTFAYTYSRQPPKNIAKLPDNVYLSMTSYATQFMAPGGEKDYQDFLDGWKSKGVKIIMREYWGMHYWLDLPVLYPDEIAREIKMGTASEMKGVYGECGKNFSTQAPNYYVLTHLLWNPDTDPQKVLDQFYAAFGPAASPVRAYYTAMSEAVHRTWREKKFTGSYVGMVTGYGQMFDKATLARAGAALDAADAKAGDDAGLKARLAFVRQGLDYTVVLAELLGVYEKLGRSGFPLEAFEWQATAASARRAFKQPDFAVNREFFEARLQEPFHYTLAEKDAWMQRAWELGQRRIVLLNAARPGFALDEGLYAQTLEAGIRQWHQTVAKYLGKAPEEITPLEYTKPAKKEEE